MNAQYEEALRVKDTEIERLGQTVSVFTSSNGDTATAMEAQLNKLRMQQETELANLKSRLETDHK